MESLRNLRTTSTPLRLALVALVLASQAAARDRSIPRPADPFADPKDDPYNPLGYIASNSLSAMGVALTLAVALAHTFLSIKYKTKFMLAMVVAAYTYALGIAIRFGLHKNPESSGLYIIEYLFVTLSPCGIIAAEYVLLGRLAQWLGRDQHMLVSPKRVTLVFVLSDVTTFLIQAAGGSISASAHTDISKAEAGSRIFLAGIALQLVSFAFFTALYLRFIFRMHKYERDIWVQDGVEGKPWYKDWRALAGAMFVSCVGVLIRSVYRTIELSQGFDGFLTRTEVYFYALDFVPLLLALAIYIVFWPGRFIPPSSPGGLVGDGEKNSNSHEGTLRDVELSETKA